MRLFSTWTSRASLLIATVILLLSVNRVFAHSTDYQVCPRYAPGSTINEPKDLFSSGGVLRVNFKYQTRLDASGNRLFCFTDSQGNQSPTLHVKPGDKLIINTRNELPSSLAVSPIVISSPSGRSRYHGMSDMSNMHEGMNTNSVSNCSPGVTQNNTSVNIHYHGSVVRPICHQDEVISTLINSGDSFEYEINFPLDQPSGLLWYHPHVHGIAEPTVQGGATGALVVEGLEEVIPSIAGLPERVMVIRDYDLPGNPNPGGKIPSWDLSLNYINVPYPDYPPVVVPMKPLQKQFWRLANTSADSILDIELSYDGIPQPLEIVALDGVGIDSQDGTTQGKTITRKHIFLGPANRAEFIVTAPSMAVKNAVLRTLKVETGPDGDNDPTRDIAVIKAYPGAPDPSLKVPPVTKYPNKQRFAGLSNSEVTAKRKLYFSEVISDPTNPNSPTNFYITVDGQTPVLYNHSNPPAITTTQGTAEEWTIENRSREDHIFHIHQTHFLVVAENGVPLNQSDGRQYHDSINIPFWSGIAGDPYPSKTFRIDFRGQIAGEFVYHCHILGHEDNGMMAIIRINKPESDDEHNSNEKRI